MNSDKQSMKWLHLSFWLSHLIVVFFMLIAAGVLGVNVPLWLAITGFAALILTLGYCFAIAAYASALGRSGLAWGGLSFLAAPLGIWVSYAAAFFLKPAEPAAQ